MNKSILNLGKPLSIKKQRLINGGASPTCNRGYCLTGRHEKGGNPICVPCGNEADAPNQ
ncbi:hypothetical protein OAT18_02800 [Tenacibaculum sp.]|nr:hypothetical protein [Tenacibaculum sp.]